MKHPRHYLTSEQAIKNNTNDENSSVEDSKESTTRSSLLRNENSSVDSGNEARSEDSNDSTTGSSLPRNENSNF